MSDQNPQDKSNQRQIQIQLDEQTAKGIYANLVMVSHTENEFVFDYIFLQPSQPTARVQSRVIVGPRQAKRLAGILQDSVKRYEDRFGAIPADESPQQH